MNCQQKPRREFGWSGEKDNTRAWIEKTLSRVFQKTRSQRTKRVIKGMSDGIFHQDLRNVFVGLCFYPDGRSEDGERTVSQVSYGALINGLVI